MNIIKKVVVHSRAHLEEFLITYLFANFGKRVGYKIHKNFSFLENSIGAFASFNRSLQAWASDGILPVGTLGSGLDEHAESTGNRKEEGSAIVLASNILFKGRPVAGLRKLISFVSNEDQKAGQGEYNLSYVVKILQSSEEMTNHQIFKWLSLFFDAEHHVQWKRVNIKKNSRLIKSLFLRYKDKNPEVNMVKFRQFIDNRNDPAKLKNYNLSVVVNILHAYGVPVDEIYSWIKLFFDSESYRQDIVWPRAQSEAAKGLEMFNSQNGPKVAYFESDEEVAHMVARVVAKPDLTIIRRSTGHIQMFTTSKGYSKPSIVMMDRVIHALRVAEGSLGTEEELKSENFENSPWYFHVVAQNILNGSHSAPDVPATELSLEDIKKLVLANIYYRPKDAPKPLTVSMGPALKGIKVDRKGEVKKVS